ncbi:hypothetical protein HHK36_020229 [Tetracentron sinense]|uniref:Uncharacterized protein n=1 Tax=Tetracentron sinense TaxID=13715 RepID=A0A834YZ72_TETSI|nr:hypothetical protein HHK36_020229 [Tetracentron sinense]
MTFILIDNPRERRIVPCQNGHQSSFDADAEVEDKREGKDHVKHPITKAECIINMKEKVAQVSRWERENAQFNRSIFRVPKHLREVQSRAYTPQLVSIGPYHRGKDHLKEMENQKWRLLQHVLERTHHQVEHYYDEMSELEEKMRRCYAQRFEDIDSPEFVEMMLLDACFVVELLNASDKTFMDCWYSKGDPIFGTRGVLPCIQRDMLMLENQIPLFLLDKLYTLTLTCNSEENNSVSQLALQFFDSIIPGCQNLQHKVRNSKEPGLHLLRVVHQCLLPSSKDIPLEDCKKQRRHSLKTKTRVKFQHLLQSCKDKDSSNIPQLLGHSVMTLRGSGVRFQKNTSENFMDIEFKNGILYIPPLVIHNSTKSIFLNFMAFEQYYPNCSKHVTSYIRFMDGLINSHRDVEYLRYKGIIDHKLGSEQEVAGLVNKFCKEIAFDIDDDCYLSGVYAEVNKYFDQKWHVWRAILKHEYFTNPWATLSILAGSILIALAILQTIYTVMGYYE